MRHERERNTGPPDLVEHDVLLDRGTALPAVHLRPTDAEPTVLAELSHDRPELRAVLAGVTEFLAQVGRDQLGKVRT